VQKNDVKGCRQAETNKKKKEKRQTPMAQEHEKKFPP